MSPLTKGRTAPISTVRNTSAKTALSRLVRIVFILACCVAFQGLALFFYQRLPARQALNPSTRTNFSSTHDALKIKPELHVTDAAQNRSLKQPSDSAHGAMSGADTTESHIFINLGHVNITSKNGPTFNAHASDAILQNSSNLNASASSILSPQDRILQDLNASTTSLLSAQALPSQHLNSSYTSHPSALNQGTRLVNEEQLQRQITSLDSFNPLQPSTESSKSYGNLTEFSKLRDTYFDTYTDFEGAQLVVSVNSSGVSDVSLFSDGKQNPPYVSGLENAVKSVSHPADLILNGRDGFVYNQRESSKRSKYRLIMPVDLNNHRHAKIARIPKICHESALKKPLPWLLEFSNVWMTGDGDIFVPIPKSARSARNEWDVHAYQYQGGVVITHWSRIKGKRVVFRGRHKCKTRTQIGFAITQNHGRTYYHVTNEVIPRLLTFWEVAMSVISVKGGKIASAPSSVVQTMLRSFGVPQNKIMHVGFTQPCFFEKLYMPAPFLQGYYQRDCLQRTTGRIMGDNVAGESSKLSSLTLAERRMLPNRPLPMVVLIDRARGRDFGGTMCQGTRCMANFPALRRAIENEFWKRIDLQILSGRDRNVMRRGIELFSKATVVLGMHGAGFSNLMYMRGEGTYAIHLGWKVAWQIYGNMAAKFNVDFVNIVTRGASQHGTNAVADIPVLILELRRILEREGYPLDPPRIRTDPGRNALVSMRLPASVAKRIKEDVAKFKPVR